MTGTTAERATLLISAASASVAFMLAFNLGAFEEVFYEQLFTVWVIASIVFVASLVSDLPPNNWAGRLVLLLPTAWVLVAWVDNPRSADVGEDVVFWLTVVVTVVALPFVAWTLISAINPEFVELPTSNKFAVGAAVLVFFAAGYLIGARNDSLLTCDDFTVSGNHAPSNCVKVE